MKCFSHFECVRHGAEYFNALSHFTQQHFDWGAIIIPPFTDEGTEPGRVKYLGQGISI